MVQKIAFHKPSPFELYLPEGQGSFPLICLTPILGRLLFLDDLFMERHFARFFASNGFAAALIERPIFEYNSTRGLEQIQRYLEESILRNEKVLDELLTRKEINPQKIGSFGISFGAVLNSLWAASDFRLKAHVFALAGGNVPEILITSRDPLMRSYLKAIMKSAGKKEEELKEAFEKVIRLDPLKAAPSIPRETVFMMLGVFDRVIRFRYGLALWRALGKPETLFLPLGHYTSLVTIPFTKWRALEFFKKRLANGNRQASSQSM